MTWKDDNFWKQVMSFRGCGQNDRAPRWGVQKILLLILLSIALVVGILLVTGVDF